MKIRVLVADDHPAFREGLCHMLAEEDNLEVVGKAASGEEAVKLAKKLKPDVAVIDVAMPGVNGIEAARQIKKICPATAILIVSAYDYQSYVLAALQAGAAGYLTKNVPVRELVNAIGAVHAGQAVFDLKLATKLFAAAPGDEREGNVRPKGLQRRELEVLRLVAKGRSNKDIARELIISERTVQTHMVNIFHKFGVSSRTEAVVRALREGWLNLNNNST